MEEGNNTAFMSIKMDETLPDITNLISQRTRTCRSTAETVLSTSNNGDHQCLHSHNFSAYPMEENHGRLLESGLGHSPPKKIHLDRGLDVNTHNCVDEMTIDALMTNLDKHPQDEQDIISVMYCMRQKPWHILCSANEFVQQDQQAIK